MSAKRNWVTGCGIGCLVLIAAAVIGGSLLWRAGKEVVAAFDDVGDSQRELTRLYGGLRHYVPPVDGRIAPDRIEVFLDVLADTRAPAVELSGHAERLRLLEGEHGLGPATIIKGVRSIASLGRSTAAYMTARNEALLDRGMGFGEYSWLWTTAYLSGSDREFHPTFSVYEEGEESERRPIRLRGHFEAWLENQADVAEAEGHDAEWVRRLRAERRRIRGTEQGIPWRDELPAQTAESLAPFRERLEAAYVELGAMLCIGADKAGSEGFEFEIE